MARLSRRDTLKLVGAAISGILAPRVFSFLKANDDRPNIIIILCDALSSFNLSLHGYPRLTTPNIDLFAGRSTVYHANYSAGNFTTPGTASMLTGMFSWNHRAINQGGMILPKFISKNPYTLLGDDYFRFAFSQNPWPDRLVSQFYKDVDRFLPPTAYSLRGNTLVMDKLGNDRALASIAIEEFLLSLQADTMGSSVFGYLYKSYAYRNVVGQKKAFSRYAHGIPEVEGYVIPYLNEDIYYGVLLELLRLESEGLPYFAYFHLFSPHSPYKPRKDFLKLFQDNYEPKLKPVHALSPGVSPESMLARRTVYDQQIAQVDDEFGKLVTKLDESGVLDHSYLILTSDHGEAFERGFVGHGSHFLYEPAIRIPLLIHGPGQTKRNDIFAPTSNVDLLPTLAAIAGKDPVSDIDGRVLPGFGGQADENRALISMYSAENPAFAPIEKAAISMRKGAYKLIAYLGYTGADNAYELYDLENDPDELRNLTVQHPTVFSTMKNEFLAHLEDANQPYRKK